MSALLNVLQTRLEAHFTALAELRGSAAPVFALEHDLEPTEFRALAANLHQTLTSRQSLSTHWLLWVVYAAELGYDYEGDEYWQTFEARMPHWRSMGSREQLRTWFYRFHRLYGGVQPSGAWAEHFSIIAWPITHAVLPKDLQFQFARALHTVRYRIARAGASDVAALGRLVGQGAWDTSSRFRKFVEQEALVGGLVLALLGAEEAGSERLLRAVTLRRVVTDLERARVAREWLAETRHEVTRFKGAGRLSYLSRFGRSGDAVLPNAASRPPSVRPTLVLRRAGQNAWDVLIDIPSFVPLASETHNLNRFLRATRCVVAASAGTWAPGGWLLSGPRMRRLACWPAQDAPLIRFEHSNPALDQLLAVEGTLTLGPVWPCQVGTDGSAREVLGRQVRPGKKYILLHTGKLRSVTSPMLKPCEVSCDGVSAVVLKVPNSLTGAEIMTIEQFGLLVCRTVRLWPAGLAARRWDGEGRGEWLTTERPSFGIVHDHPVDMYALSLNGGEETIIKAGAVGQPVFAILPTLSAGDHVLKVRALSRSLGGAYGSTPQHPAEGMVALSIREPVSWKPGTTAHGGLAVVVEPSDPDLDDLLSGQLRIQIQGPEGRHVTAEIMAAVPKEVTHRLVRRRLPASLRDWRHLLSEELEGDLSVASRARLVISGEELGEFQLALERDVAPLRWAFKRDNLVTTVRLIDELGNDHPPIVTMMRFETPAVPKSLDPDICRAGTPVQPPGSLYSVQGPASDEALVVSVPPSSVYIGIEALGVRPDLKGFGAERADVPAMLALLDLWGRARVIGPIGTARRLIVVRAFEDQLYRLLCGARWLNAEVAFRQAAGAPGALIRLGENVGPSLAGRGFAAAIRRGRSGLEEVTGTERAGWFAELAERYQICGSVGLSRFALRLATQPRGVHEHRDLDARISELSGFGMLMRGARLAALSLQSVGWEW